MGLPAVPLGSPASENLGIIPSAVLILNAYAKWCAVWCWAAMARKKAPTSASDLQAAAQAINFDFVMVCSAKPGFSIVSNLGADNPILN